MGFTPKDNINTRLYGPRKTEFSRESFIRDVFNEEYILVVGSEVILDPASHSGIGDVNQYILEALNQSAGRSFKDFDEVVAETGEDVDPIRTLLASEEDFSYSVSELCPQLRSLLETGLFPIVLTTTVDGYLETLMRSIWGEDLRVVNIYDDNSLADFRHALAECRGDRNYHQPTLFYIFGKAVKDRSMKFVRTDNDAIQIIEKWMTIPREDRILKLIRNKKLLALGCKYENWYFRFFWYILKHDFSRFVEGQVAFLLDENDRTELNLKKFLDRTHVYVHGDARTFMAGIQQYLVSTSEQDPLNAMIRSRRRRGGVFLSYCSRDHILAEKLFFRLSERGYNVWFDSRDVDPSDDYNEEIAKAIGESRVVISLLTPAVARELGEGRKDPYYILECRMALQNDIRIIPLAANGYDLRSASQKLYEEQIGKSPSGLNLMEDPDLITLQEYLDNLLNLSADEN